MELQTQTALVFIVTSSLVLLFLFFFKSSWSAWLLVFLFCVGAIQVRTQFQRTCIGSADPWSKCPGLLHLIFDSSSTVFSREWNTSHHLLP